VTPQVLTEADFDSTSWHDNHIHAFRFVEGKDGAGDLVLDLDHIVEWLKGEGSGFQFKVVPATLTFHEVMFPRISIDFGAASAAFGPIMIDGIERRTEQKTHYVATIWRVPFSFPPGEMEFEARGFTQKLQGQPILTTSQSLDPGQRGRAP
jgi:hypothetical protein